MCKKTSSVRVYFRGDGEKHNSKEYVNADSFQSDMQTSHLSVFRGTEEVAVYSSDEWVRAEKRYICAECNN